MRAALSPGPGLHLLSRQRRGWAGLGWGGFVSRAELPSRSAPSLLAFPVPSRDSVRREAGRGSLLPLPRELALAVGWVKRSPPSSCWARGGTCGEVVAVALSSSSAGCGCAGAATSLYPKDCAAEMVCKRAQDLSAPPGRDTQTAAGRES